MNRSSLLALGLLACWSTACVAPRPDRVLLTRGDTVPEALSHRSRRELSDYYARTASAVDAGTSVTVLARIVDRSYVRAAERERARGGHWTAARARAELERAELYYLADRLSFEVEVGALLEAGLPTRRFSDVGAWQWTLAVDGSEPIVATDATTTRRRTWREQGGGGYFQGRTFVPEPVYVIEHHDLRGVVRFGPPAPMPQRVVTLRAYPPGVPAVLRLRWRVARQTSRGA